jgi:hypothetical protein
LVFIFDPRTMVQHIVPKTDCFSNNYSTITPPFKRP